MKHLELKKQKIYLYYLIVHVKCNCCILLSLEIYTKRMILLRDLKFCWMQTWK